MARWQVSIDGSTYEIESDKDTPPSESEAREIVSTYNKQQALPPMQDYVPTEATPLDVAGDVANTMAINFIDWIPGVKPALTHAADLARYAVNEEYRDLPYSERIQYAKDYYNNYVGDERNPIPTLTGNIAGGLSAALGLTPAAGASSAVSRAAMPAGQTSRAAGYAKRIMSGALGGGAYGALDALSESAAGGELPSVNDLALYTGLGSAFGAAVPAVVPPVIAAARKAGGAVSPALRRMAQEANRLADKYKGATSYKKVSGYSKGDLLPKIKSDINRFGTGGEPLIATPSKENLYAASVIARDAPREANAIGLKVEPYLRNQANRMDDVYRSAGDDIGTEAYRIREGERLAKKWRELDANIQNASPDQYISYDDILKVSNDNKEAADAIWTYYRRVSQESPGLSVQDAVHVSNKKISPATVSKAIREISRLTDNSTKTADESLLKISYDLLESKGFKNIGQYKHDYNKFFETNRAFGEGKDIAKMNQITAVEERMNHPVVKRSVVDSSSTVNDMDITPNVIAARRSGFVEGSRDAFNRGQTTNNFTNTQKTYMQENGMGDILTETERLDYLNNISTILRAPGDISSASEQAAQAISNLFYPHGWVSAISSRPARGALNIMSGEKKAKELAEFILSPANQAEELLNPSRTNMQAIINSLIGGTIDELERKRDKNK